MTAEQRDPLATLEKRIRRRIEAELTVVGNLARLADAGSRERVRLGEIETALGRVLADLSGGDE